jgi:hypothetical protein
MKCSYHPAVDSRDLCSVCNKPLCPECAHTVKGKPYCQDCLVEGAEWVSTVKGLKIPADSPKRAALCAIIPGLGAVYNSEYTKAITYFAVFSALVVMSDRVNGIFGLGSFVFLVFTMIDAHRSAEAIALKRLQGGPGPAIPLNQDKTIVGWGVVLILLGLVFLLQNFISFYFLHKLWPLVFILLGGFLVYRTIAARDKRMRDGAILPPDTKEDI